MEETMNLSIIDQVVEQLDNMPQSLQQQVLLFAKTLTQARLQGTPGQSVLKFAETIPSDDLTLIKRAIEEDCGVGDFEQHVGSLKLEAVIATEYLGECQPTEQDRN